MSKILSLFGGFKIWGKIFLITVFIKKEQNFLGVFQNSKQIHMPKISDREAFLIELNDILRILAMYDEEHTESFKEVYDVYVGIQLSRYMNPRNVIPKSRSLMDLLLAYEDHQFKVIATKSSFLAALNMIESNPVFCEMNSLYSTSHQYYFYLFEYLYQSSNI